MPTSSDHWTLLSPCLLRLYRELEPDTHAGVMLEVLNELVPSDSVVLNVFEVETQRYTVRTLPHDLAKPEEVKLVGGLLHQSPFPAYYVATGDGQWKMTTDFMPVEDFHGTDLHRLGLSRWGINQQICGMLAFTQGAAHALTINRTNRGFNEGERDLLNALHPHLVTSYLNAMAHGRSQQTIDQLRGAMEAAPGAYGYVRPDGSVAWMQERAREWLALFLGRETQSEDGLPLTLRGLIADSEADKQKPTFDTVHLETEKLTVCVVPSPLGGWIVRLERAPLTPPPFFHSVPMLSARENEVLAWMVQGKRNAEIGSILSVSPRTVEKHVESILCKLEVENRASAIVRAMEMCSRSA